MMDFMRWVRPLDALDQPTVRRIVNQAKVGNYRFADIILGIAHSRAVPEETGRTGAAMTRTRMTLLAGTFLGLLAAGTAQAQKPSGDALLMAVRNWHQGRCNHASFGAWSTRQRS